MYPEYTGTGFLVILQPPVNVVNTLIYSNEKVFNYVQSEFKKWYKLTWLKPIGFNNTYALMMRKEQAARLHLETISDLKKYVDTNK